MGKGGRNERVKRHKKVARHKGGFHDWNFTPAIVKEYGDFIADIKRAREQFVKQQKKERHALVVSMSREDWHEVKSTHDSAFKKQMREFADEQKAAFKEHVAKMKLKKAKQKHIKSGKDIKDFVPPAEPIKHQPSQFEITVNQKAQEHLNRENRENLKGTKKKARILQRELAKNSKRERLVELKKHYTALQHLHEKWHAEASAKRALKEATEEEERAEKETKKQAENTRRQMEKTFKAAEAERKKAEAEAINVAGKQAVEEAHVKVTDEITKLEKVAVAKKNLPPRLVKVKKEERDDSSDGSSDASSEEDDSESSSDNSDSDDSSEADDSEASSDDDGDDSSDSDASSSEEDSDGDGEDLEMPENETSKKSSDNSSSSDSSSDDSESE